MRDAVRFAVISLAIVGGCKAAAPPPVAASSAPSLASDEQFIAIGTEPFWNAKIAPGAVVYSTPEELTGQTIAVTQKRQGTLRTYTGTYGGQPFVLGMRETACSDGMSDRSYRFEVDLKVDGGTRKGCAEPGAAFKAE